MLSPRVLLVVLVVVDLSHGGIVDEQESHSPGGV